MTFTGERFVPELRGQIAYEHRHRYAVCLDFARDKDVLDIACGEGYGSSLLAPVARSVTGVDIDDVSVRHAAARYPAANLAFRTGSATAIPLPDASIDVVVSFETIEHLDDHRTMLAEIVRVLRPGGRLVMSSPNKRVYSDLHGVANAFHVRELYFDEFRDLLRDYFPRIRLFGQRIVGASAVHPLHGAAEATGWLDAAGVKGTGIGALPDPEYFIGICGRDANDDLADVSSIYLDPADDLLQDIRGGGLAAAHDREVSPNGAASAATDERAPAPARRFVELQEELFLARESFSERIATVESERDEARLELIAAEKASRDALDRATLAEAERALVAERASTLERALEERVRALETERDEAGVAIASLRTELERAAERERATTEREAQREKALAAIDAERAAALAEIAALNARFDETRARIATLERARERLYERAAGVEKERDDARAAGEKLRERLREAQRLQKSTTAELAAATERLAHATGTADRSRAANEELASHVALLEGTLRQSGSVVRDLGDAHARAAAAIASLELTRRRLEFALTVRVAASEAKAVRHASIAGRLRENVSLLAEALGLREQRIAALETTMREREAQIARERDAEAAAETAADIDAQIAYYRAMNAQLRNSKLWKLRTKVRKAIGRPAD